MISVNTERENMKKHKSIVSILVATLLFTAVSCVACTDKDKNNDSENVSDTKTTTVTSSVKNDKTEKNDNEDKADEPFIRMESENDLPEVTLPEITLDISETGSQESTTLYNETEEISESTHNSADTEISQISSSKETPTQTTTVTTETTTEESVTTKTDSVFTFPDEPVELPFVPIE